VKSGNSAFAMSVLEQKVTPLGRDIDTGFKELVSNREEHMEVLKAELVSAGNGVMVFNLSLAGIVPQLTKSN
jgi:hypothetical protein